jgi:hypothetical protein
MDTEVAEKEAIWEITSTSWSITKGPRKAEGEYGCRRPPDGGPCSHVALNSAEVCSVTGDRIPESVNDFETLTMRI